MIYPFNDADMTYSHQTHRYTLTPDAVRQHLNVDLDTVLNPAGSQDRAALVPTFLASVSREIYAYIYSCGIDNFAQEYTAAKHPAARRILLDAMLSQVEYEILNGSIYNLSGVDVRKGHVMDTRALRRVQIAPMAQDVLARNLDANTASLVYRGSTAIMLNLPAYEEEGY